MEKSDKVRIMSHFFPRHEPLMSFFTKFYTFQKCGSVETSDKLRIMSYFSPGHETSVIHYLVLHFSELWRCGIV